MSVDPRLMLDWTPKKSSVGFLRNWETIQLHHKKDKWIVPNKNLIFHIYNVEQKQIIGKELLYVHPNPYGNLSVSHVFCLLSWRPGGILLFAVTFLLMSSCLHIGTQFGMAEKRGYIYHFWIVLVLSPTRKLKSRKDLYEDLSVCSSKGRSETGWIQSWNEIANYVCSFTTTELRNLEHCRFSFKQPLRRKVLMLIYSFLVPVTVTMFSWK